MRFSGHQGFPLRFGWLPKAVQAVAADSAVFTADDATVRFGVGINMVSAIRHWAQVTGVMRDEGGAQVPTVLGRSLFSEAGWDPFFEDPGTSWLLHWRLVSDASGAALWHLLFTHWSRPTFRKEELVAWVERVAALEFGKRTARSSLSRDVDCLLRSYLPPDDDGRRAPDEGYDSPFLELGLIRRLDRTTFALERGPRPSLPWQVLALAIREYWRREAAEQKTLPLERLLHGPGSPGGAFQLSDQALIQLLEDATEISGLAYDESAGMRRVVLAGGDSTKDIALLELYYSLAHSTGVT